MMVIYLHSDYVNEYEIYYTKYWLRIEPKVNESYWIVPGTITE